MGRNEHPQPDSSKNRNEAVPTSTEAAAPPEWPRRPLEDGLALATERAPWHAGEHSQQEEHHVMGPMGSCCGEQPAGGSSRPLA